MISSILPDFVKFGISMNCEGQVKIVGDKLHLSSCSPDKLSSLA